MSPRTQTKAHNGSSQQLSFKARPRYLSLLRQVCGYGPITYATLCPDSPPPLEPKTGHKDALMRYIHP